jgi:hypothetical protein
VSPSKTRAVKRYNGPANIGLAAQEAGGPAHTPHRLDRSGGTNLALAWLVALGLLCAALRDLVATLAEAIGLGTRLVSV